MYTGLSIITSVSDRSDDNVGHKIRYPFLLLDERQQSTEFISMMKIVKSRDADKGRQTCKMTPEGRVDLCHR